jgi:hypothetical protein
MRIGLYPARADRLDLRRYSDRVYVHCYEAPCTWKKETQPFDPVYGARGVRKTHSVALTFDEPDPSAAALFFNRPLRLQWTPAYMARAGAVVPAARRRDREWTRLTNRFIDFLAEAMLRDGGTGYVDYFDLPHGFNVAAGRWHHDFGGFGYINDEAMPCLGLFQAYFLTGRADALAMARAMARHNGDMDTHHAGPWAGIGSRHHVNHWGDQCKETRISQPIGKRFNYYLEGDRSVLDLLDVMMAAWRRRFAAPAATNMTCEVPALVASLLLADETGSDEAAEWLDALADALAESIDETGRLAAMLELDAGRLSARPRPESGPLSFMMFSCFGGAQCFAELAERLGHDGLRAGLVRMARYQMLGAAQRRRLEGGSDNAVCGDSNNAFRALDLLGYAYSKTGDAAFVRYFRRHTRALCVRIEDRPEPRYGRPGAGLRRMPVSVPWPRERQAARASLRRYYPLIAPESMSQLFSIAVYLHKMQAIQVLSGAHLPTHVTRPGRS